MKGCETGYLLMCATDALDEQKKKWLDGKVAIFFTLDHTENYLH